MANEWKDVPLGQVAEVRLGKMLDQKKNKGEHFPYLANTNVQWGQFELSDLKLMKFEADEIVRYGLIHGDIVMCEGGEPGRCAIWHDELKGMLIQKALFRIRPFPGLDHRYLYYTLFYGGRAGHFSSLFTGTTIKHLPRQNLLQVRLRIPSLATQQAIAHILGTLDDKIECNRRMNHTLESIVRTLFQS